jgi:NosR/NirI family transcriptional regulator, nitrous oxide reductase regulator
LGLLPYIYLGAAVLFAATGSAFIICEYDPFVSFFRRSGSFSMLSLGAGFLLLGVFVGRPYCRFLCPYGAMLRVISVFSKWNVTLSPQECIQCQICDVACPYGAIDDPAEASTAVKSNLGWAKWAFLLILAVLLAGGGGWLGGRLAIPLSRMHATVRLAERIAAEDSGKIADYSEGSLATNQVSAPVVSTREENARFSSKAFRRTGKPAPELTGEALRARRQFQTGGWLLGAFAGLIFGLKLAGVSLPKTQTIYEPNRSACVACGRCFTYCPNDLIRLKKLQRKKAVPATPA